MLTPVWKLQIRGCGSLTAASGFFWKAPGCACWRRAVRTGRGAALGNRWLTPQWGDWLQTSGVHCAGTDPNQPRASPQRAGHGRGTGPAPGPRSLHSNSPLLLPSLVRGFRPCPTGFRSHKQVESSHELQHSDSSAPCLAQPTDWLPSPLFHEARGVKNRLAVTSVALCAWRGVTSSRTGSETRLMRSLGPCDLLFITTHTHIYTATLWTITGSLRQRPRHSRGALPDSRLGDRRYL